MGVTAQVQILATDFFSVGTVWLTSLYVLFLHEGREPRRSSGWTYNQSGSGWLVQQARNLANERQRDPILIS